jgi:hypothetical protein
MVFVVDRAIPESQTFLDKSQLFSLSTQSIARMAPISQQRISGPFHPKKKNRGRWNEQVLCNVST